MPAHQQPGTPFKREEVGKSKQNPTDTSPELQTALIWLWLSSVTLTSSWRRHPRCHPSTWLSLTSQCLPMSRLGRNWWPDYIEPQNLFTAQGLLKEQLNVRHTKKYFIAKWESKEFPLQLWSVTCVRSTIEVKPQRPTVPLQHLCYCIFLWKKSHSRLQWNFSCRGSLAVKAKEGRLGFTFYNIPSVCHFTQIRVRLQVKDLSILTTSEHNFCLKSGLAEYSPPPEPQNYPNLLLHRKCNFLKPLC